MSGDICGCHNWRIGILLASREAAKASIIHRAASTAKKYLVQKSIVPALDTAAVKHLRCGWTE